MVLLVDYVAVFAALAKNQDNHENSANKTNGNHRKPDDYVYRHFSLALLVVTFRIPNLSGLITL
jgi:hypothetical protein